MSQGLPEPQGLYDPRLEHDACGIGFVVDIAGRKSHSIVQKGLEILLNLTHRGACGCDPETGDGAGILIQVPDAFYRRECSTLGFDLPAAGAYGVAMLFLPVDPQARLKVEGIIERHVQEGGLTVLGWRDMPVDPDALGRIARASQPYIEQLFVEASEGIEGDEFERRLYMVRRRIEKAVAEADLADKAYFSVPSFSSRTIVYKGLLLAEQIPLFYAELNDPEFESALCLVHQRFSTNTFPTWPLAHPYRYLCHNGEINTIRGNVSWLNARQAIFESPVLDLSGLGPVVPAGQSDSASLDNAVELLTLAGRSLPHVMAMLIPEAWDADPSMDDGKKAFYEFHASLMEPWDGPAAVAFTDGRMIGATLDRNGLRPARYLVTKDGLLIMASEAGVLPIPPENIVEKGRLQPGKMLLVDTQEGRIVPDSEIKQGLAERRPYRDWLEDQQILLDHLPEHGRAQETDFATLNYRQRMFGYTGEDIKFILEPMAARGDEPIGSMGVDTPLACLSDRPQLLFNYFKQLFAQVTNPAIDPLREDLVMSLTSYIGYERNILDESPEHCHTLKLQHPILTNHNLEKLRRISTSELLSATLPMLYRVDGGHQELERSLDGLCRRASLAIKSGYRLMILSDRGADGVYAPIPSLLALTALHNHLVREGTRTQVAIIIESGEPREVMHFALLIGYGASAVNPYLAIETLKDLGRQGRLPDGIDFAQALRNYRKAVNKGLLKVFSKMGISTLQSYRGAQIFEAIGLTKTLVDKYFTGTPSRIEGVGLDVIARESLLRHEDASRLAPAATPLPAGGDYAYRADGEHHMLNPDTITKAQRSVREGSFETFEEFSRLVDEQAKQHSTLRGLMEFRFAEEPLPLDEVEPASEIVKRFATGAMSYGSISKEAHETLAVAMNQIGGRSNTGEGGEDETRFVARPDGTSAKSAIKQVASGRFGVTTNYLVNADELQIKVAQGAKPGEGGQLPGHKVDAEIARVRHSIPGVGLVSPPPHHDIYSIEDLAQLIYDLKNVNPSARISVKLVSEVGVGTVAAGVAKAHADVVLISGYDGGTGASPLTSIRHAGAPWELGLAETQQTLVLNNLRSRIRVQVDGKLQTGRDVVIAALLGAEEFGFATAPLVAMGCIMMRKCHLNTCPVGIATQNPELRKRFAGKPEHVVNYLFFVAEQARSLMARLGFRTFDEMVGNVDRLEMRNAVGHWKAKGLDLSSILYRPEVPLRVGLRCTTKQDHGLNQSLDHLLLEATGTALNGGAPVSVKLPVQNQHRAVGAMLSGEVARRFGAGGLPPETIRLCLHGSAGQSLGAFLASGVSIELKGETNDYVGKGLSGGKISVRPPCIEGFVPEENVIVGNTALYGATSGEAFFNGKAGERFAVRNSGATAVVEGVGDHGCEYMTKGVVVVLGPTGKNFAAGMSGGLAFVLDEDGSFARVKCNTVGVDLEQVDNPADVLLLNELLEKHVAATGSPKGRHILDEWEKYLLRFVKVFPHEYKRALGVPQGHALVEIRIGQEVANRG